jgi:glycine cleavage system regulatory protein
MMANQDADENDVLALLAAATQAFTEALGHSGQPRTIAVEVEASYTADIVEISLHDYAGQNGNTVELQRQLRPARHEVIAATAPARK